MNQTQSTTAPTRAWQRKFIGFVEMPGVVPPPAPTMAELRGWLLNRNQPKPMRVGPWHRKYFFFNRDNMPWRHERAPINACGYYLNYFYGTYTNRFRVHRPGCEDADEEAECPRCGMTMPVCIARQQGCTIKPDRFWCGPFPDENEIEEIGL